MSGIPSKAVIKGVELECWGCRLTPEQPFAGSSFVSMSSSSLPVVVQAKRIPLICGRYIEEHFYPHIVYGVLV